MKMIRISAILAVTAVLSSCSERSAPMAPSTAAVTVATASLVGDQSYTWTLACHGGWALFAQWSWTQNGGAIASGSASCGADETLSGTGVRPANANGFTAQVGTNSNSWTFDPAAPFSASLSGSAGSGGGHCFICFHKESGKLTVDS